MQVPQPEDSEPRRLRALESKQLLQQPQLIGPAVEAQFQAPGADTPKQPPSRASQSDIRRGGVERVQHALKIAHVLAQVIRQPGKMRAVALRELPPWRCRPLLKC